MSVDRDMPSFEMAGFDPENHADIQRAAEYLLRNRARAFEVTTPAVDSGTAVPEPRAKQPSLRAISDLHANSRGNREHVSALKPCHPEDWLIVAGDVAERLRDIVDVLATLAERFETVIWVPGNHELWSGRDALDQLPAPAQYAVLVAVCRMLGVITPEDPYPVWTGPGGPATVVPLFLLYDYSWRPDPTRNVTQALAEARARRVIATDEYLIDPTPFPSRSFWCAERLRAATRRLAQLDPEQPTVLINHWPLVREPTRALHFPEFAMWCGTEHTGQWPARYRALACVYGHLHIPRSHIVDGVRHEEVSLGYPREWGRRGHPQPLARQILPVPATPPVRWLVDDDGRLHIAGEGESGQGHPEDTTATQWQEIQP